MTNLKRISATLKINGVLCDDCLSWLANVYPRQTVNSICRSMATEGVIYRSKGKCPRCKKMKISNKLAKRNKLLTKSKEKTSIQNIPPQYSLDKFSTERGKRIVLVSCVKKKAHKPLPAKDLYNSTWFKYASGYAKEIGNSWYILSAKYGLLTPSQVITPYEKTLNNMPVDERRSWAKDVLENLFTHIKPRDEVVFLAGVRYREFLINPILKFGCNISIPMEGIPFFKQIQWLKNQHDLRN